MSRLTRLPSVVLLVALGLVACDAEDDPAAGTAPVVQLGAPGGTNRELTGEEVAEITPPAHTDADVAFVHDMIAHHEQALAMTAMVAARTGRDDLPLLAERMDVSQRDEIVLLERWLADRGEPLTAGEDGGHAAHAAAMPGMLTDAELAELERSQGSEFDERFLADMIRHHEGAIVMVERLLTEGAGGQESAVFQLAQGISTDQAVEIARMKALLAEL